MKQLDTTHVEYAAYFAHEINRAYCRSIGDNSQLSWEDAPEWQRNSAIDGVKFTLNDPESTPADSHANWYALKEREGWKYGPVKDPDKKEHPCFVPYDMLSVEQKTKDYLFQTVVRVIFGLPLLS